MPLLRSPYSHHVQETPILPERTSDLRPLFASIRCVCMLASLCPPRPVRDPVDIPRELERQDASVWPRTRRNGRTHEHRLYLHGHGCTLGSICGHTIYGTTSALPVAIGAHAPPTVHRTLPPRPVDTVVVEPALVACQPSVLPGAGYGLHLGVCRELVRCYSRRGMCCVHQGRGDCDSRGT